jgi:hypothetical protein
LFFYVSLAKIQSMNIRQLIEKTRTYRRFDEKYAIDTDTLVSLVDLARLSASGANRQPLKYILVNALLFIHVSHGPAILQHGKALTPARDLQPT